MAEGFGDEVKPMLPIRKCAGARASAPRSFGNSGAESQRDSGAKPRVARHEQPWETVSLAYNPNGVAAWLGKHDATPSGLKTIATPTQGSSCLATLGWRAQSLWDCRNAVVLALLFFVNPLFAAAVTVDADICVYGGTSGGVTAA